MEVNRFRRVIQMYGGQSDLWGLLKFRGDLSKSGGCSDLGGCSD